MEPNPGESDWLPLERSRFLVGYRLRRRMRSARKSFDAERWTWDRRHDLWTLVIFHRAEPMLQISFFPFELRYAVDQDAARVALKRKLDAAVAAVHSTGLPG